MPVTRSFGRQLIVETDRRLLPQLLHDRAGRRIRAAAELVVVVAARASACGSAPDSDSGSRGPAEYSRFAGILPSTPPSAKHAVWSVALQAPVEVRILDEVEQRAVVVERLREVSRALERRRHAQANRVAVVDRVVRRTVLVAVEEEQLVVAARLADRTANRVAERLRLGLRLGIAVQLTLSLRFVFQSELVRRS